MTYHVTCPFSGKKFYRPGMDDMRRFVYAMMTSKHCQKRIRIYDGSEVAGTMWMKGGYIWYQRKGSRKHHTVREDGTFRT